MISFLIRSLVMAFSMFIAVSLSHGMSYDTVIGLLEALLLFGLLSAAADLFLLTERVQKILPKTGLFKFLLNTLLLLLISKLISSFHLDGIATAFWGSFIIACAASLMDFNPSKQAAPKRDASPTMKKAKARVVEIEK